MADTKPKKSKQQVTLKRRVTVKAIVTDKFKEYLKFELEETIRTGKIRVKEIETAVANLDVNDPSRIQMLSEKKQIEDTVSQAPQQESAIKELENDTFFPQGVIEGFVNASVGDNLYEKLGALEIVVKDGIIENISLATAPSASNISK
ncbi:hypothetical protein DID75_05240 [Candidatus Marinamargulisbacteria bacterium SCGC AG-410-N11]|nr:hypothetical protein DID75_05240 [Candidatus Marinamargulisbacteria bacterium SCGC AG-410-N11]